MKATKEEIARIATNYLTLTKEQKKLANYLCKVIDDQNATISKINSQIKKLRDKHPLIDFEITYNDGEILISSNAQRCMDTHIDSAK